MEARRSAGSGTTVKSELKDAEAGLVELGCSSELVDSCLPGLQTALIILLLIRATMLATMSAASMAVGRAAAAVAAKATATRKDSVVGTPD